jgi:8-amino-7-oxononanoate synthase
MDLFDKLRPTESVINTFADTDHRPFDTLIEDVLGPCEVKIRGHRALMFGSNNYLGLTFHPEVREAAKAAIDHYGAGTTGSRVANGSFAIHTELERDFAAAFEMKQARVFTTGHQANLSIIAGLCGADDTLLIDQESHASIYDASKLTGSQVIAFRHNSATDLAKKLARLPKGQKNRLVVVEGLYSIRGDVAPLRDIVAACKEHGAYLLVDEAHSFGVYGARGLGCCEDQGVLKDIDFLVGTFSKSLAGIGGFCVSNHDELRLLHFSARAYMFTASGSPATIAGTRAALRVLAREPERRATLWSNVRQMRAGLSALGYQIGANESPIVPILIGDAFQTIALWQALLDAGLYVNIVLPPGCPMDQCLLRTSYSAAHTEAQIDEALGIFADVGRQLGVIPQGR